MNKKLLTLACVGILNLQQPLAAWGVRGHTVANLAAVEGILALAEIGGDEALGDRAPDGPILGAHVEHVGIKEALLADNPDVFFTTPHFDGYPAILVRLDRITVVSLEELIVEAWVVRAPKRLAREYLAAHSTS